MPRTWSLLLCLALAGCSARHARPVLAEVLAVETDRSVDEGSAPPPLPSVPAIATTRIAERGRYLVPTGHAAVISFVPGVFAVARDAAEIECEELRLTKDGNETGSDDIEARAVAVKLRGGSVTFALPMTDVTGLSTINVRVGQAEIKAGFGALFYVSDHDGLVRVTCVRRGGTMLIAAAREVDLGPGQFCELRSGVPEIIGSAADNQQAQFAMEIAMADEQRIASAIALKRKAAPAWRRR